MQPSSNFYNLIRLLEGCFLKAYKDSVGIATIGIGTIKYPNGVAVMMGDVCTEEQAYEYLKYEVNQKTSTLNGLVLGVDLNQNQFDAITSLTYNIGVGGFASSTVLKLIKKNPNDTAIEDAWMMWNKGTMNGKKVAIKGLTNRRKKEYHLYSTPM
jgi:lysozyme